MTYLEIIERACVNANRTSNQPLEYLRARAEAVFPSIVEELAQSVAADIHHPWRSVLRNVTADLADGAPIPQTSADGKQIIGVYGSVRDATDDKPLEDGYTLAEIRALNENPNGWRKAEVYGYAIIKPNIYHTRENVYIEVCTLDEATVTASIAADIVPIFPDAEGAYVTALVERLTTPPAKFAADDLRQAK